MKIICYPVIVGLALLCQPMLHAQSSLILNERLESPTVSGYQPNIWPNSWGWFSSDNSLTNTAGMDNVMAHSGSQSLYFSVTNGAGYESIFLKGVSVNLNTNDVVTYSFWVRSDALKPYSGNCVFVCALEFHDTQAGTTPNVLYQFVNPDQMSTSEWTKFTMTGSPAAHSDLLMFVMKSSNFAADTYTNASGTMYFDDLQAGVAYANANPSNILVNPSFEQNGVGWILVHPEGAGGNVFETQNPVEDGSKVYKCWGTGVATNIQSIVQSRPAAPGYSYTAGGFARNGNSGDIISAPSQFWLQVDFLDASSNVLTSYESQRLDYTADTYSWTQCDITNQVDPLTHAVIGSVTSLVAPTGTVRARFSAIYSQNTSGGGSVQFDNMSLIQTSGNIPPMVLNPNPDGTMLLNDASSGFSFTAASTVTNIDASGVQLLLNGQDVSSGLNISGSGTNSLNVTYPMLQPNVQYTAVVNITDQAGATSSSTIVFDTYSASNFSWEGEDYDYGGGQYINQPAPLGVYSGSYQNLQGNSGVDYYESGLWGGDSTLRESYGVGPGIGGCFDATRYYDLDASSQDYYVGWFDGGITNGDWVNYTRSVPAGKYNVVCRMNTTQGTGTVQLAEVASGAGTTDQATNVLGDATADSMGTWTYATVMGTNDSPLTLNYSNVSNVVTYRVSATTNTSINFFMLVPVAAKNPVQLSVSWQAGKPVISFPSQLQATYSLQFKNNLTDASWTTLPGTVTGDGTTKSITDTTAASAQRFYRVMIQ